MEHRKEYQKEYYIKMKEKRQIYYQQYYLNNKYKYTSKYRYNPGYQKEYYLKNKEKIKVYSQQYYIKNHDNIRVQQYNYYHRCKCGKVNIIKHDFIISINNF